MVTSSTLEQEREQLSKQLYDEHMNSPCKHRLTNKQFDSLAIMAARLESLETILLCMLDSGAIEIRSSDLFVIHEVVKNMYEEMADIENSINEEWRINHMPVI